MLPFQNNSKATKIKFFRPERLYINGREEKMHDFVYGVDLKLDAGTYLIETEYSQPVRVKLNQNRRIRVRTKFTLYYLSIIFFIILGAILKFGFGVDKIIVFDYFRIVLLFSALTFFMFYFFAKKYIRKIIFEIL